jgi:hypothetical protein
MSAWLNLFLLVKTGGINAGDAARLAQALVAGIGKIGHGQDLSPDEVRALVGDALPIAEQVAELIFPAITPAVGALNVILSMSRPRTFEEEQRLNARASQSGGV